MPTPRSSTSHRAVAVRATRLSRRLGVAFLAALAFTSVAFAGEGSVPSGSDGADLVARDGLGRELSRLVASVHPAVVAVRSMRNVPVAGDHKSRCQGTGVILDDGLIATTLSVAGPGDEITITYHDGTVSAASVAGVDPSRELALLRPVRLAGQAPPIGSPDSLHAGSWVFVVGFSLSSQEATLASGRFSSRTYVDLTGRSADPVELLQLEASVYPGTSGGAVVDARGRLVGVVMGGISPGGFLDPGVISAFGEETTLSESVMLTHPPLGISLALPIHAVADLCEDARAGRPRTRGFVGVRVSPTDTGEGVTIVEVVDASPAARAGLRRGDRIVVLAGKAITDVAGLGRLFGAMRPGDRTTLEVRDGAHGDTREAELVIGDYTADYQMRFVWSRLLTGRAASLEEARSFLRTRMRALDDEILRLRTYSSPNLVDGRR